MLDQHRTVHVELSAREPERTYCLQAEKGQHLQAEITNPQGLDPSGKVISPAGDMDGPGVSLMVRSEEPARFVPRCPTCIR
jgi:hypothetical protein